MRRTLQVLLAVACTAIGLSLFAPLAATQSNCDQVVVDNAGIFKENTSSVTNAAQKLASVGADVRVRTFPSLGGAPTLDALEADVVRNCPSWQNPGGTSDIAIKDLRKSNLVVFAMTLQDRKVGIFYGGRWTTAFSKYGGEQQIYANIMGPNFKNGNFAKGFTEAMGETQRVFNNFLHPSATGSGATTVNIDNSKSDYTWVLWTVLSIVAALLLGAGVWLLVKQRREKADAEEQRKVSRQRARSARDSASEILHRVGDPKRIAVRNAKVAKYSPLGEDVAAKLSQAQAIVDQNYEDANNRMASAAADGEDVDSPNLSAGELDVLAQRYEDALDSARHAEQADKDIDSVCADIDAKLAKVSSDIATTQTRADQLKVSTDELAGTGVKVDDIVANHTAAMALLDQAQANSTDLTALQHLKQANAQLDAGEDALDTLKGQVVQVNVGVPKLEARIKAAPAQVQDAKACFDRISGTYADSCWESVAGNGTEATRRFEAADAAKNRAVELSGAATQDWAGAVAALDEGERLLDEADGLLTSISKLEGNLAQAKASAESEINDAAGDIEAARSYLHQYEGDFRGSHNRELADALSTLEQARTELFQDKPDYLLVVKLATTANSAAGTILNDMQQEHEKAERTRRQAVSTLSQAESEISRAKEYIDDHSSDVGSTAGARLRDAQHSLEEARGHKDPAKVLEKAQAALESAGSAYSKAKSDFDNAEDERRREREREQQRQRELREAREARDRDDDLITGMAIGSSMSHHHDDDHGSFGGFGGSSGGGSSFDWGSSSSDSGGGSSFDFGGSSDSGGGSSDSW